MGETGAVVEAKEAEILRRTMVDCQIRTFDVTDIDVLAAFEAVPREPFVAPEYAAVAYSDLILPCLSGGARMLVSPMVLARLLQEADLRPCEKALDVAGGSGYGAAILAQLGLDVTALESGAAAPAARAALKAAGAAVKVVEGDVTAGVPGGAFDFIVIHGVIESRPEALLAQLSDGGRLVALMRNRAASHVVLFERSGADFGRRVLFDAAGPDVAEFRAPPRFVF